MIDWIGKLREELDREILIDADNTDNDGDACLTHSLMSVLSAVPRAVENVTAANDAIVRYAEAERYKCRSLARIEARVEGTLPRWPGKLSEQDAEAYRLSVMRTYASLTSHGYKQN